MPGRVVPAGPVRQVRSAVMRTPERIAGWGSSVLLLPRVVRLAVRAPRDWRAAWERYWGNVRSTGVGGDVLWDAGDLEESGIYERLAGEYLDTDLPLVDAGCGNARFTRHLVPLFPSTVGVDLSHNALVRAAEESAGLDNLTFAVADLTEPAAGREIRELVGGDANVFIRGVLHVLEPADRVAVAGNLHTIVGARGRVLLAETNFPGSKLQYLRLLGATPGHIPAPLERAIAGIPSPGHFGVAERQAAFPAADWDVVADGATDIMTIPLRDGSAAEHIPGYFAILVPTAARTDPSR